LAPSGKPDDLDAWVLATAPRAVAYAASLLRDRTRAEDIVQDCYCRLLQKANRYDLPHSGLKLLFKAITRACINVTRSERRVVSLDTLGGAEEATGCEMVDTTACAPEQDMMYRELEQAVADGLARLPMLSRAALELKCLGHAQHEIADMLAITTSHAGVLVHRARQALAAYLVPFVEEAAG
jgi:RNA polymerase sigma-70 factor (ECF subfamily)